MSLNLPEPDALDVWGTQLNDAIEGIAEDVAENTASIDAIMDLLGDQGGEDPDLSGFVRTSSLGVPDGVATLDNAGFLPASALGNITAQDVGAAAAVHQHALSDLPSVQLMFNSTPAMIQFNTTTDIWPSRATVTSVPTRPVIWWGDADLPADAIPGVDLAFRIKSSPATVPTPVPEPPPSTAPDGNGVALAAPVVTVNGSAYSINGAVTTTTLKTFTYLQLAVRDPNGVGYDTGYNNGKVVNNETFTLTGSGTAAVTGNWTVRIAYSLNGTAWINGAATTFNIATLGGVPTTPGTGTPGSGSVPILGLSGKTWNSGVCDKTNGNLTACTAFGTWRGAANDAIMVFPARGTYDQMYWLPDSLNTFAGYRVIALPTQPSGSSNSVGAGASGTEFWTQWGKNIKDRGWDDGRTILRLNWEANGNWYSWSWMNGGATQFVAAMKNAVNAVRIHAPKTKINLCLNRGNVNGGIDWKTQIMDPLIGWIDIIGLDNYDFSPPSLNQTQFNSMAAINPGLTSVKDYCLAKGLKMSIDEWGVCNTISSYPGGYDNPFYITAMKNWMTTYANAPLVMDLYFNINADGLGQRLYPESEGDKPNSSARYKSEF